jgi:hypothetical protein
MGDGLCKHHGGSTPGGRAQALKIRAGRFADQHAQDSPDVGAVQALQDLLRRAVGRSEWLRAQVEDLEPGSVVRGTTLVRRTDDGMQVVTVTEARPEVAVVWRLYVAEEDRIARTAKDLASVLATMNRLDGPGAGDVDREAEEIVAQVLELVPSLRGRRAG